MKLYPYQQVKTHRLGILLFTARVAGLLGLVCLVLAVILAVSAAAVNGITVTSGGSTFNLGAAGRSAFVGFAAGVYSLGLLVVSGICAAVVSIEYHFTVGYR